MKKTPDKTFVGFGFGPIQSALFLYEAYLSKNFSRFVVCEVDAALVESVRNDHGRCWINVARKDRIDPFQLEGIELYNPKTTEDQEPIREALQQADELCTALPSVRFYDDGSDTSIARLLSEAITKRDSPFPTLIYAAENHNHAAEMLHSKVSEYGSGLESVQCVNTVIGKMSGVISDPQTIQSLNLKTLTPDLPRAILVEEFNRILISKVSLPDYHRGIEVFVEKEDLLPFEEAKLYGHNAIHALIGYLGDLQGYSIMADAGQDPIIMEIAHKAFLDESGAALLKRHQTLNDPLFTPEGYRDAAEDLLERMTNPHLHDLVARICRDPLRKLGYDDRFYGTMRLALSNGIVPRYLACGAASAVVYLVKHQKPTNDSLPSLPTRLSELTPDSLRTLLLEIWNHPQDNQTESLIELTDQGLKTLRKDFSID